jgi:hypothetical protein
VIVVSIYGKSRRRNSSWSVPVDRLRRHGSSGRYPTRGGRKENVPKLLNVSALCFGAASPQRLLVQVVTLQGVDIGPSAAYEMSANDRARSGSSSASVSRRWTWRPWRRPLATRQTSQKLRRLLRQVDGLQQVHRALDPPSSPIENVGVDHRGLEAGKAQELLEGSDVVAVLKQGGWRSYGAGCGGWRTSRFRPCALLPRKCLALGTRAPEQRGEEVQRLTAHARTFLVMRRP